MVPASQSMEKGSILDCNQCVFVVFSVLAFCELNIWTAPSLHLSQNQFVHICSSDRAEIVGQKISAAIPEIRNVKFSAAMPGLAAAGAEPVGWSAAWQLKIDRDWPCGNFMFAELRGRI